MRRVIHIDTADVVPPQTDVLHRFEMPKTATVPAAFLELLSHCERELRDLAEPRGVIAEIDATTFADVYRGERRNAPESPLELIAPRAERLALFAGTVGDAIGRRIASLFHQDDPAAAMVLDAYASEAANRVAYVLANEFGANVLPYSPGYCGWHVSGQRALFDALQPGDAGVTLNSSFLMTPIKSVSGVLVAGDAAVHRFRPAYAFCDECTTQECVPRMRSMLRR